MTVTSADTLSVDRASHQRLSAVRGLGTQHGDMWHHKRDRWGVGLSAQATSCDFIKMTQVDPVWCLLTNLYNNLSHFIVYCITSVIDLFILFCMLSNCLRLNDLLRSFSYFVIWSVIGNAKRNVAVCLKHKVFILNGQDTNWSSDVHFDFIFPRPRDSVKAIKKRIIGNKNFREIMLALTVSNQ